MNFESASRFYRSRITAPEGLKALVLDADTLPTFATLLTQTEALREDFVLVEKLENLVQEPARDRQVYVTGIVVGRPSTETLLALRRELAQPHFGAYHIFFVNLIRRTLLEDLADADASLESVVHVEEIYFDFLPWSPWVATGGGLCDAPVQNEPRLPVAGLAPHQLTLDRQLDTLFSILVSLKQKPASLRVLRSFRSCRALAERLAVRIDQESRLWEVPATDPSPGTSPLSAHGAGSKRCLVVILDRREDPVTPLLTQWTYEAMLHQFFGIRAGRVRIPTTLEGKDPPHAAAPQEQEYIVLPESDDFYAANRYATFGDIGEAVHRLVASFQERRHAALAHVTDAARQDAALADPTAVAPGIDIATNGDYDATDTERMTQILEFFPEFRRQSQLASKHVALISALSQQVKERALLQMSQIEQDVVSRDAEQEHLRRFRDWVRLVADGKASTLGMRSARLADAWRLAALLALRYESTRPELLQQVKRLLHEQLQMPSSELAALDMLLQTCGSKHRSLDLFGNRDLFARAKNTLRRGFSASVDNQYIQHEPLLAQVMEDAARGRLPTDTFEELLPSASADGSPFSVVIVYVIGGITAEETRMTAAFQGDTTARIGSRRDFQSIPKGTTFYVAGDLMHTPGSFRERYALSRAL